MGFGKGKTGRKLDHASLDERVPPGRGDQRGEGRGDGSVVSERIFAHLPFGLLEEHLPFFLEERLQPEIAFSASDLQRLDPASLVPIGKRLASEGLRATVHAPFHDLNPGALDSLVREATRTRFSQAMEAAEALGARLIVFHPGYEKWKYGLNSRLWLEASLEFWPPFVQMAEERDCLIAVENIFEDEPDTLRELVQALDSPWLGHCFDVGHWRLFSGTELQKWVNQLAPRLLHLHLHDNTGGADDHLPIGEGDIDFGLFFELLDRCGANPSMTLEAHSRDRLIRSLLALRSRLS